MDKDLKNKSLREMEKLMASMGARRYFAKIVFQWIHKHGVANLDGMSNLSKSFKADLKRNGFYISETKKEKVLRDKDGSSKYIFRLRDGNSIESVLMEDGERLTLCISSQVGCKMNCVFCATGKMGFRRNMTSAEIVDQVIQVEKDRKKKINNVVFMGMGEPLDNYENVMRAIYILNSALGKNIGARKITVSTCGIVPGIKEMKKEKIQIRLAVSLHFLSDEKRKKNMPGSSRYKIEEIRDALMEYQLETGRRISIEYLLMDGVNDRDVNDLINFVKGMDVYINLIEYNSFPNSPFKPAKREMMKSIKERISNAGYSVACRYKRGREIKAACGQLAGLSN